MNCLCTGTNIPFDKETNEKICWNGLFLKEVIGIRTYSQRKGTINWIAI
jgi:hypothetical protein